ncbi:hypothetical protein EGM70_10955 [Enterobacteriaceae bacterium 89]|nr:hypothetical protein [Enterobacteriaceae bacterium 89]
MPFIHKTAFTLNASTAPLTVVHSFEEYSLWYLSRFDFSIFSSDNIQFLLEDEQPESYPCIPLTIENTSVVIYISLPLADSLNTLL